MVQQVGFGTEFAKLSVYIDKRPNLQAYLLLDTMQPLAPEEITFIGNEFGNGWRKVFNVYAKLVFCLSSQFDDLKARHSSWQEYRDNLLLQKQSETSLVFSKPLKQPKGVQIVMGKAYAELLWKNGDLSGPLNWLSSSFACCREMNLLVCPYFDYRQLNNEKITQLAELIEQLLNGAPLNVLVGNK